MLLFLFPSQWFDNMEEIRRGPVANGKNLADLTSAKSSYA